MQITINAHVTLEEIYEWFAPFAEKMPLYFALNVYFPKFRIHLLSDWNQFVQRAQKLKANELWIDLVPIPAMRGQIDLKYKNRERFSIIGLPEYRKTGLRETSFGTVATKERNLKVWRAIIRAVRKNTSRGMWIWNDIHNTKAFSNRHGYSPSVAALHAQGLELLTFTGGNRLFIAEPDSPSASTWSRGIAVD